VDAALGSDTGGSVRIPASFSGVVGLKPTHRSVPRFGFADLAPSLDHVGTLADGVEVAARVFDAIAGPDPRDPSSLASRPPAATAEAVGDDVADLRVGVVAEAVADADEDVDAALSDALHELGASGVEIEEVSLRSYRETALALFAIVGAEFAETMANRGHVYGTGTGYDEAWGDALSAALESDALGANVRDQLLTNGALNDADARYYVAARGVEAAFVQAVDGLLAEYDALVTPTTPMTAPAFGAVSGPEEFARTIANTGPFNLTGHPALSVPVATGEGTPVGVQFVGARHDEATLVALGWELERSRSKE
jgi:aspartyl-tRNA(Asn)/glutamyl-tRNA(Gln) amidotransferase subunit A